MQIEYANMLKWFYNNHLDKIDRFVESVSYNQQKSKEQLILGLTEKEIIVPKNEDGKVIIEIVGGWFGWPLIGLLEKIFGNSILKINFFELDPFAIKVLRKYIEEFNPYFNINIFEKDWFLHKEKRRAHIIINTSCEHMKDFSNMKKYFLSPERTLLMLTSNNKLDEPDHINCKESAIELANDNNVKMLHGDFLTLKVKKREKHFLKKIYNHEKFIYKTKINFYNRYFVIGKWNA